MKDKKIRLDTRHRNNNILVDEQQRKMHERFQRSWWNRPVKWFVVMLALSLLLSYVEILRLGEGGSVTFLSMLVLCLIGYVLEPRAGLLAAFLFGVIKYILDYVCPGHFQTVYLKIVNEPGYWQNIFAIMSEQGYRLGKAGFMITKDVDAAQVIGDLFDYLIGYTLLGTFGYIEAMTIRSGKKGEARRFSINSAFIIAVILRFIESVINYAVFYPENVGAVAFLQEAVMYSFMYVGIEGILSWFVLYIPAVTDTVQYIRTVAGNKYNEKLYQEYR